jgi:tryptophan 2,3-dioxygenase
MMETPLDPKLIEQLNKLRQKYDVMGQDLSSYLDGLLHADYLTYWDYIHLDTLLSLQTPKTSFPDEKVFILYHQITELYFSLILHEISQLADSKNPGVTFFCSRLDRIIRYFQQLESSFTIMVDGLEKEQFLKFRMALLPSSGFQSAQYRMIEICSTDMINLVDDAERNSIHSEDVETLLEKLYWRRGATELASGKKTLTLRQFEMKYKDQFRDAGLRYQTVNLRQLYRKHFDANEAVGRKLKEYDHLANVLWPLAHLKTAAHYLQKDPDSIRATGGTNWQKYLPPRFQRIFFFPELWSEKEKASWGVGSA